MACQLQGRNAAEKKIYRDPPGFGSKEDLVADGQKPEGSGGWVAGGDWLVVSSRFFKYFIHFYP